MSKKINLTEFDIIRIVKQVINETKSDRIVFGDRILNVKNKEFISNGYSPYYLDLKKDGEYKIVKVNKLDRNLPKVKFYFLNDDEVGKLDKLMNSLNELISEYLVMIDLYKKQLIGVLEEKIIK
jgi:hypothetical protein